MARPGTQADRADRIDLAQRYRWEGYDLQERLATQVADVTAWTRLVRRAGPEPAVASAGPSHASVATVEPRRCIHPSAAPPKVDEAEPKREGGFAGLPPRVREIIQAVADEAGVPVEQIMSHRQLRSCVDARQECYRRLRRMPWAGDVPSLFQIGLWLHRDHSTVHHGLKRGDQHGPTSPH